jgi:hypothetical protein
MKRGAVKTMLAVLLLSALSFGQVPMTKAQKQDCAKLTKTFKKHATDPNLTAEDVTAMLAAVHEACGTADPAPTSSTGGCTPEREAVKDSTCYDLAKERERIDAITRDNVITPRTAEELAGTHETPPATVSGAQPGKVSQSPPDIHARLSESITALNREIALGNRLIAHLQKAQTWEGIDADHPEAVALRAKISQEEKELREAASASSIIMDSIDIHLARKSCSPEEIDHWVGLVTEATGVLGDVKTQQDRYHALGY